MTKTTYSGSRWTKVINSLVCLLVVLSWNTSRLAAQSLFPIHFLSDVGHLDVGNGSSSAKVGSAKVFPDRDGALRFEGRDANGKPWRVWVEQFGGIGPTNVWTADFDRNGQPDLLIAPMFPKNGRCVNGLDIVVLLFDQSGRPVPWSVQTEMFGSSFPYIPAFIADLNGNGHAQIVPVDCEYAMGPGVGTDWTITGVYEARNARMIPMKKIDTGIYERAIKSAYAPHGANENWIPTDPNNSPDQMSGMDTAAELFITALIPADEKCRGGATRLPPIVNGKVVTDWKDPCKETGLNRTTYSDGQTRPGWPKVIIDGLEGRDIYAIHSEEGLRRIVEQNYPVKLLGNKEKPSWVWADARKPATPLKH